MMDMRKKSSPYTPKRAASRPSNRSGASPTARREKREWNFGFLRLLLKLTLCVAIVAGVVFGLEWLNPRARIDQFMNRPIAGVSVESEFKYISQQETQNLVAAHLSKTFLELDMLRLKQALETNPWIDKVMISRTWPDKLVIHIQEQKPIALWGNLGFLNMRGEIVKVSNAAQLTGLPLFKADEHYAKEVMQQYLLAKNITTLNGLTPNVIEMDDTMAWTVYFTSGLSIKLGREKALEKLQNIANILRTELAHEQSRIEKIDMRYDNGFAVAWKDSANNLVANTTTNASQRNNNLQISPTEE